MFVGFQLNALRSAVASLGVRGRTPSRGVTPEGKKFLWANLERIVEKQRGRTGKKGRQVLGKNRGVTLSVAAPGVTHPSDASDSFSDTPRVASLLPVIDIVVSFRSHNVYRSYEPSCRTRASPVIWVILVADI